MRSPDTQALERFLSDTEPAEQRGKWQTVAINRYKLNDQHFWIARRCRLAGETYEGLTEVVFLAVVVQEMPDGTLELLPQDEEA